MSFAAQERSLGSGGGAAASIFASMVLHVGIVVAFLEMRPDRAPAPPPFYKVNLVAAQPSPAPAIGRVEPPKRTPPPETKKAPPPRPKSEEVAPVPVAKAPEPVVDRRATPSVSETRVDRNTPAPVAGGGEVGGKGADVGNVKVEGIDFPYPGYLDNIVRQIRLRFQPSPSLRTLKAEVSFLIRRDGTIMGFRFTQASGNYRFDIEVQGAVESAAEKFGPLPAGFRDDVLPVLFSFDPRLIGR